MLRSFFHNWERRLASVTTDRVVRPFDWGLDWVPDDQLEREAAPADALHDWVTRVIADTDAFFTPPPTTEYSYAPPTEATEGVGRLTFPSALTTPHAENNTVYGRYFPATRRKGQQKAAVVVMPQWNADEGGHVGLCRLLSWNGMSALRLTLPYHDQRMPPELHRADYIVSANVARTLQVCRQGVLDARRAIWWLRQQGYQRIGILGTSIGSCLALLTTAHEPLVEAQALNHISPYFADVVWRGLSTEHVREGLDGHVELDLLRALWRPISPRWYLDRVRNRKTLLVYAHYDLTFPIDLSMELVQQFEDMGIPHEVFALRCGHYSTGKTPFKFVDGFVLTRFLRKALVTG